MTDVHDARVDRSTALLSGAAPDDLLRLDRQVCFALSVASRNVVALYRPVLEPLGLTHPQYLVMLTLWERDSLTVKQIGQLLSLDPATLSPLLKRLERAGLIRRDRHPADERALQVPPQVVERLGMDLDDLTSLHAALTRVIAATRP